MTNKPIAVFGVICVASLATLTGYLFHAKGRMSAEPATAITANPSPPSVAAPVAAPPAPAAAPPAAEPATAAAAAAAPPTMASPAVVASTPPPKPAPSQPIFFRHTGVDSHYGSVAQIDSARPAERKFIDALHCEVVHVSGGSGICLTADRGVFTTYAALLFDASTFKVTANLPLKGIPSRSRVSSDGRYAAFTVFLTGHGYSTLDFSTQTLLLDARTGAALADLESFAVTRNGQPFKSEDFNFWGVTFTPDAERFFATLSTDGKHYLVKGDIANRTATVIHENVECPSLSPDARRIAYKKRFIIDQRIVWQLHTLDLATGAETPLAEKRSIDDQLEWLSDSQVLYSVPSDDGSGASTDVWMSPADASAPPKLFLRNAYSPATARTRDASQDPRRAQLHPATTPHVGAR